jgi:c-di-GMP-related signal transduction protein
MDIIARQPIMNRKAQVHGYKLAFGQSIGSSLFKTDSEISADGSYITSFGSAISAIDELSGKGTAFIDFSDEVIGERLLSLHINKRTAETVFVIASSSKVNEDDCKIIKSKGYRLAMDSSFFLNGYTPLTAQADIMFIDFPNVSLSVQIDLIQEYKGKVTLLANRIETWEDFNHAKKLGYDYYKGYFFLWPTETPKKGIKTLDVCMISIIQELDKPDPSFKHISDTIEHDLGLSYKLLRLVNSAYMAPKHRITSISQALTYIGTRELYQWISMLMLNGVEDKENSELIKMSLIRGKLMALIARELNVQHSGTEPFFTGLFSLIDVILNRDINEILSGLPLSDHIKAALRGEGNDLQTLQNFVIRYEQAQWNLIEGKYPINIIGEQKMISLYLDALKWANVLD